MQRAVEAFESDFARWHLHLPAEAIESRRAGQIRDAGWSIRYNFGRDARGEYLDYYASPRDVRDDPPGDDWHVRVYASGERATLPPVLEAYMYGRDPTWEELERSRRQYAAESSGGQTDGSTADALAGECDHRTAVDIDAGGPELDDVAPVPEVADGEHGPPAVPRTLSDGDVEATASDAAPDALPYLPLDIGLHMDLGLAQGSSAEEATAGPPAGAAPKSPDPSDELFFAPEDLAQFLPAPAEESEAEEHVADEPQTPPSLLLHTNRDDTPAPITLETAIEPAAHHLDHEESGHQPGDIVSEEDEPPRETLSDAEAKAVQSIGAVPLAEPDSLSNVPLEDETAEGTDQPGSDGDSTTNGVTEAFPAPPLVGKAIPTKIFRRADLVLTADAATIDPHVDPRSFRPWWLRPHMQRAAMAIAAVLVIAIIAVARARHRAKVDAQALGSDVDTAAISAPPAQAASSTPADSSNPSDTAAATPDSAATSQSADSTTAVSATVPEAKPEPLPDLRPPGDHSAEEGMAKPAGPRSLEPITPAGKAATAPSGKYPTGAFPRGYNP